jgi:hypothetical protein
MVRSVSLGRSNRSSLDTSYEPFRARRSALRYGMATSSVAKTLLLGSEVGTRTRIRTFALPPETNVSMAPLMRNCIR